MKRFWLSFICFLFSAGVVAAGFYFHNEAMIAIGLICASFNASVFSACIAVTVPVTHRHIIEEKSDGGEQDGISS